MPEICNWTGSDILGGTGNISPKHPGIWSVFSFLALFFHLSTHKKVGSPTSMKIFFKHE